MGPEPMPASTNEAHSENEIAAAVLIRGLRQTHCRILQHVIWMITKFYDILPFVSLDQLLKEWLKHNVFLLSTYFSRKLRCYSSLFL